MKIVFVDALTNHGGQEKYIINLLLDLSTKFQYDSYLITSHYHTYKSLLSENIDRPHLLKLKNFSTVNILTYISLLFAIRKIDPKFVIFNGEKSIFFAKVLLFLFRVKVKFIAIHHLLIQDSTLNVCLFKKYIYGHLARNFHSKFFKVIFINEYMKYNLQRYEIPEHIIEFKNNGTNLIVPTVSRDILLHKHSIPKEKNIIGYIGQFNKQKNLDLIFSACEIFESDSNIIFLFIGTGEEKNNFKQKVLKNDLKNVLILDFQEDIHNYFQIFDCLIFPSFYEGLPLTLLEAISHKVPTITSNIDGHRGVLTDLSSTISFSPNEPDSLVQGIQFFLDNKSTVEQYVENAYKRYLDNFNWMDVLSFYDNLLANK